MLSDKARTGAYRDALTKNPTLINDANVLDVGCGTGILSMFAARDGGARNVGNYQSDETALCYNSEIQIVFIIFHTAR